jgi:hypothetical protein
VKETPAEKLRAALDLADLAERMLRQKLTRDEPGLGPEEIEARIDAWYAKRPGAEHGDTEGRPRPWPPE